MEIELPSLSEAALSLAVVAGEVANFCDHAEHNEPLDITVVRQSGETLRLLAVELARDADSDVFELYTERLAVIESRNVLRAEDSFDGAALAREAETWRDIQLVQAAHDKTYHSDVVGLTKSDQLRHYSLHLAKLAGATASVAKAQLDHADWLKRRVPDMLLFGIKLATVSGETLTKESLPRLVAMENAVGHVVPLR